MEQTKNGYDTTKTKVFEQMRSMLQSRALMLAEKRVRLGFTQEQMSIAIGMSKRTIISFEAGLSMNAVIFECYGALLNSEGKKLKEQLKK